METDTVRGQSSDSRSGSGLGSPGTFGKVRFAAFTLVVATIIGLSALLMPAELLNVFAVWSQDFGVHQVHDAILFAFLWLALVIPAALLLYRPSGRVNTVLVPVLFAIPFAAMALLVDSPLVMLPLIFGTLGVVALALHPAGRDVLRFDRVESIDRRLAGLYAVGAVPLLVYGGLELAKQLGPVDDHVLFVHFGSMGIAAFLVVVMGALAVFRRRDYRFAALFAGITALYLGVVSVAFPAIESSLGTVGGALLMAWSVAFAAGVLYVRSGEGAIDDGGSDRRRGR